MTSARREADDPSVAVIQGKDNGDVRGRGRDTGPQATGPHNSGAGRADGSSGRGRTRLVIVDGAQVTVAEPVRCADCYQFRPGRMPLFGRCAAGEPESPGGLWAQDRRACPLFLAADLAESIRAMAARWQYLPDELAWALEQATKAPAGWCLLIDADLRTRLCPGGEGETAQRVRELRA